MASTSNKKGTVTHTIGEFTASVEVLYDVTFEYDPGVWRTANGDGWPGTLDVEFVIITTSASEILATIREIWENTYGEDGPSCPLSLADVVDLKENAWAEQLAEEFELDSGDEEDDDAPEPDYEPREED
jgi:hypothetical protein